MDSEEDFRSSTTPKGGTFEWNRFSSHTTLSIPTYSLGGRVERNRRGPPGGCVDHTRYFFSFARKCRRKIGSEVQNEPRASTGPLLEKCEALDETIHGARSRTWKAQVHQQRFLVRTGSPRKNCLADGTNSKCQPRSRPGASLNRQFLHAREENPSRFVDLHLTSRLIMMLSFSSIVSLTSSLCFCFIVSLTSCSIVSFSFIVSLTSCSIVSFSFIVSLTSRLIMMLSFSSIVSLTSSLSFSSIVSLTSSSIMSLSFCFIVSLTSSLCFCFIVSLTSCSIVSFCFIVSLTSRKHRPTLWMVYCACVVVTLSCNTPVVLHS
ncbi:unnamed protein product [Nesidiocoris tenuis]|uniref:Uncharacterized protein n=1 Tax=Nesidiocoris tenuis TaxID=355587 RepID=A0A6H5G973_9HEMI|nr:unnamed protein product [Nesidiocoris tenuis]